MKTFIITLNLQAGEYEKTSITLVKGINEQEAMQEALLAECHCTEDDGGLDWADGGVYDLHGEFHYSVRNCTLVNQDHVAILSQYIV